MNARNYYIPLETIFEYEHSTKYIFSASSSDTFLSQIDDEEFSLAPFADRIILQDVEAYLEGKKDSSLKDLENYCLELAKGTTKIKQDNIKLLFQELPVFLKVEPQLPDIKKQFLDVEILNITTTQSRADIIQMMRRKAINNEVALLSMYAYRDMDQTDWRPFVKAALERNPVSLEGLKGKTVEEAYHLLSNMPNDSIYDAQRLAQPDEVWNFGRGDGVEKAILFANFLSKEMKVSHLNLIIDKEKVNLLSTKGNYLFHSQKEIVRQMNFDVMI